MAVEDRLQSYSNQLNAKKYMLEEKLKPTFKPTISSSSKRIHHRSVQNTAMTHYPTEESDIGLTPPKILMTAPKKYEEDVIEEEEDKDDSDVGALDRI